MNVRVELDILSIQNDQYYLNGQIFTGLAYDHRDQQLYKVYEITNGKITAEHDYGFFNRTGFVKLDYEVIEDIYDNNFALIYQEKLFNGITYDYDNGFVSAESLWIDGYIIEAIGWRSDGSGMIDYYHAEYPNYNLALHWQNKQLREVTLHKGEPWTNGFTLSINEYGKIDNCSLNSDNIANLGELILNQDVTLPFNSLNELFVLYPLAEKIKVKAQNDTNLNYFLAQAVFHSINDLELLTQGLSPIALEALMNIPNLQHIFFYENDLSERELDKFDKTLKRTKRQAMNRRNHDLFLLLCRIQDKFQCDIKLMSNLGFFFSYNNSNRIKANLNEANFADIFPSKIFQTTKKLDLTTTNLSLQTLEKLKQLINLQSLTFSEKNIDGPNLLGFEKEERTLRQQQDNIRNQALMSLLKKIQTQLHCDIKLTSSSGLFIEQRYGNEQHLGSQIRIKLSYLSRVKGDYYFYGLLFNGLAYDHQDHQLRKVYQITEGKITAEYDYGFFNKPNFIKLDYDVINKSADSEHDLIYQNKLFNGITYQYDDNFVKEEKLWINGHLTEGVEWTENGRLVYKYYANYPEYQCHFTWTTSHLYIASVIKDLLDGKVGFSLEINRQKKINYIYFLGNNIATLGQLTNHENLNFPFNTLETLLAQYPIADDANIARINDNNFIFLVKNTQFHSIKKLMLDITDLSISSLEHLMYSSNLQYIYFYDQYISEDEQKTLDDNRWRAKQKQYSKHHQALISLLLRLRIKYNCDVKLTSSLGISFDYRYTDHATTKLIITPDTAHYHYLLSINLLEDIEELEITVNYLSIAELVKLAHYPNLHKLHFKFEGITHSDLKKLATQDSAIPSRFYDHFANLQSLLLDLQNNLHCDIKFTSSLGTFFERSFDK